jgi:hypothetical protein
VSLLGLAVTTPSAFAARLIDTDGGSAPASPTAAGHGGMAGWQMALIAVGVVLAVVAVAVLIRWVRPRPALHSPAR